MQEFQRNQTLLTNISDMIKMSRFSLLVAALWCALSPSNQAARAETLRPPSVPLVACDPYFSVWSPADKLTDAETVHWTGKRQRLESHATIDGVSYGLMGKLSAAVNALPQTGVEVFPTRTIYS